MTLPDQPVKLILTYDPPFNEREEYVQFILGRFLPTLEYLGLELCDSWHTAYGDHPLRLTGFIAPDLETMEEILLSESFIELETILKGLVSKYRRRIVPVRAPFPYH
jgi:hypothetical protein